MSIIHDALKKAQEQRKDKPEGVPFGNAPEPKKKPPYIVIGVVALVAVIIIAYLYIPAFHPTKAVPPRKAGVKPAPVAAVPVKPAPQKAPEAQPAPAKPAAPAVQMAAGTQAPSAVKGTPKTVDAAPVPSPKAMDASVRPAPPAKRSKAARQEAEDETVRRIPARKAEDDSINRQYNEALQLMNSGQLKEAQKAFLALLGRKPDHVEALNNMGVICASMGNRKDAVAYFKKVLEYRPNYPKAYNNMGLLMMTDNPGLAEEYFTKAIALEPEGVEPYLNLAALLRTGKKFAEAAKVLEVPISRNVKDASLYLAYAVAKDNMGLTAEAIRYYRQYLGLAKPSRMRDGVVERLRYLEERGKR